MIASIFFGFAMIVVGGVCMALVLQACHQADTWLPSWMMNAVPPRYTVEWAILPGVLGFAVVGGGMWFLGPWRRFQFCLGTAVALHALNLQVLCTWQSPQWGPSWDDAVALGKTAGHALITLLAVILSLVALLQEPPLEHRQLMREDTAD